jgi:hypothetical protein
MKRKFQCILADVREAVASRETQRALAVLVIMLAMSSQAHAASSIADQLQQTVNPYVNMGIRVFGAIASLAGMYIAFKGFVGHEQGWEKIGTIGSGLIAIGFGIVCIGKTGVIVGWLNLSSAFSTGS